jgi:hypothetical protein
VATLMSGRPLTALVVLAALALVGAPADAAPRPTVRVTMAPGTVELGDDVTVRVRTTHAVRGQRATLQRKVGSGWAKVLSRALPASRKLDLTVTPPLGTQRYRVVLARKGATKGATSPVVSVKVAPVPQTAGLALVTSTTVGADVTATATFTPARAGRSVRFQRSDGGNWTTVATRSQSSAGKATYVVPTDVAGSSSYRATTVAAGGLPAVTSAVRSIVVAEPASYSQETVLVSHDLDGGPANAYSQSPSISDDGRFVAFDSDASDLVEGDPDNDKNDIFLWDRDTDTTVAVSARYDGGGLNSDSDAPSISGNGRYVAYSTNADFVVDGGDNPLNDGQVYRWDRLTGETILVSHGPDGGMPNDGSGTVSVNWSGDVIAYVSAATDLTADDYSTAGPTSNQLFRWSEPSGDVLEDTILLTKTPQGKAATGIQSRPFISDSGGAVAFTSRSLNLDIEPGTPLPAANEKAFLWRSASTPKITALLDLEGEVADGGSYTDSISGDGTRVGISYAEDDLADVPLDDQLNAFVWQPFEPITARLASRRSGSTAAADSLTTDTQLSEAGGVVTFRSFDGTLVAGDTNGFYDLFVWRGGDPVRIGMAADGEQPNQNAGRSELSGDGEWLVLESYASNLTDVAVSSLNIYVTGTG